MNFINKVLDSSASGALVVFRDCVHTLSPEKQIERALSGSPVCFDMGVSSVYEGFQKIPELFRLPYERCWFEAVLENGDVIGVACSQHGQEVECAVFVKTVARSEIAFLSTAVITAGEKLNGSFMTKSHDQGIEKAAALSIDLLCAYLSALNCVNVRRVEKKPDAKLQKARQKRGKRPLFSFWVLEIDLERSAREDSGWVGSHASPRLHLRRGHARQHRPGVWCWVRAHAVGSKSAGLIHKDYAVKSK